MSSPTETLVVDFKFGVRKPSYIKQVKEYVDLIKRMGYPNVQGYLWYVFEEDGIVPIV